MCLRVKCWGCRKDGLYMDRFEDMPDIEDLVSEAELAGEWFRCTCTGCPGVLEHVTAVLSIH